MSDNIPINSRKDYYLLKDHILKKILGIATVYLIFLSAGCYFIYLPIVAITLLVFACLILIIRQFYTHKFINYLLSAELIILVSLFYVIPVSTYYTGGLYSPILWWYIMIPVVSLLSFGKGKETNFNTFICLFSIGVFSALQLSGYVFPYFDPSKLSLGIILSVVALLGIILNFSWIFETQTFKTFQNLSKEKELLKISEASYRDIFENTEELIINVLLENATFVFVNPAWLQTLGYTKDEMDTLSFYDVVDTDSAAKVKDVFDKISKGEMIKDLQLTLKNKSGKKVYIEGQAGCLLKNGKPHSTRGILRNITERKLAEEKINKSQVAFEQAQELAKLGSWELNFFDRIPNWSKQMREIFELVNTPAEELYMAFKNKIFEEDSLKVDEFVNKIFLENIVTSIEVRILDKEKEIKYINILGEPLKSANSGKTIGVKGTAQDITKQKLAALAKSNFLSTMSHEIRTPINGVIGITNLLMGEILTDIQKEYVNTLNFSSHQLLTIVSDILDFSKIESGNFSFEKVSFNMEHVCNNVFKLFESKALEKGLAYTFKPCKIEGFSMYGDHVRLSQVLSNLVSNAIKFTQKGGVSLQYFVKNENADTITIRFEVSDSGIGIPQSFQKKIFESFSQADETVTRQYGGTGLGLTISKRLVELQAGQISVESIHGKGSVFSVEISYDKHIFRDNKILSDAANNENNHSKTLHGMKVLVAEDNNINAMVLTRFLHKWGIENVVAKNGNEAIKLLQHDKFDVVLMDLQMPILDGREATKIIRKSTNENIYKIPVIALTADALIESQRSLMQNGFNDCVTKPFSPDVLFKVLQKYYMN